MTAMTAPRSISFLTHGAPELTADAVRQIVAAASVAGIEVRAPAEELRKHGLEPGTPVVEDAGEAPDLSVVLGGDGTILGALRASAETGAPVFAFNFGAIGFLSTVDHDQFAEGIERLTSGDYEILRMPALTIDRGEVRLGVNDVSFHRRADGRVAELGYSITGDRLGEVRCDGLVASTPVGSTGYNSPTAGQSWHGGWRALRSRSSPRTRSPPARSSSPRTTP